MTVRYRARKTFKYGGKTVKKGRIWKPAGGKFDKHIMDQGGLVYREVVAAQPRKRKPPAEATDAEA